MMRWARTLRLRFRSLLERSRVEEEIDEELRLRHGPADARAWSAYRARRQYRACVADGVGTARADDTRRRATGSSGRARPWPGCTIAPVRSPRVRWRGDGRGHSGCCRDRARRRSDSGAARITHRSHAGSSLRLAGGSEKGRYSRANTAANSPWCRRGYLDRSSPGSAGLAWPSGTTAGPLPPSSTGASSSRTRCRCRTLRFRLI
jgi:hypothetical protein